MRNIVLFILIFNGLNCFCQEVKPLVITSHSRATVTTDPKKGVKDYPAWAVFPSEGTPVRRIKMLVTLGCSDSLPCAHWDYLDHITLVKNGGKNGKTLNYELGRMLTPYGSIYSQGWDFTWTIDVTDFSLLLRDSVLINYAHSGYEPASVGWSLTLKFEITEGPPVVKPVSVLPMWTGSFRYGDPAQDIEQKLSPIRFDLPQKNTLARFRIQHTGHGMDRPKGCSEFCSRWREVLLDGKVVDHRDLWKDCGSNPLYPQGGTWIYDRALWCPGDLQVPDVYDFFTTSGGHTLDINMEPYRATANIQANEDIASFLFIDEAPEKLNDVSVEEIMVPNNNKFYNRMNPAVKNPQIVVKNLGRDNLKKLKVEWFENEGAVRHTILWTGDLPFNKMAVITCTGKIESPLLKNRFTVKVSEPNGRKDAWEGDNVLNSEYGSLPVLPEKMILQYLTNNRPQENSIVLTGSSGDTVFNKKPAGIKKGTLYTDTLFLKKGDYELFLTDTAGNGLEFWYESEQGYGYLRLLDTQGRLLHNFESDCGNGQYFAFRTHPSFVPDTVNTQYAFVIFPRRVRDSLTLDYHSDKMGSMEILITSDGVPVETHWFRNVKSGRLTFPVGHLPAGRYIMDVMRDGVSQFKRRFNKE